MSSSDVSTANIGFSKIQDTVLDSKLVDGLVNAGVFPKDFQIIKGTINFASQLAVGTGKPIIDAHTGNQIQLPVGATVLFVSAKATTTLTSGGSATVAIGLSATASSSGSAAIATSLQSASAFGDYTAGLNPIPVADSVVIVGANSFAVADVAAAPLTAGALSVTIVVA